MNSKNGEREEAHSPSEAVSHNISLKDGKVQITRAEFPVVRPVTVVTEERPVKTGIEGLDKVMGGGFEENSVNIIAGGPGSGKTIFSIQFLVNGIEKFNEPGVYITFEEREEDVSKFGWDLKKYQDEHKLVVIEYTPEQVKKLLSEGGGEVDVAVEKIKAKRIVIDSLTAFAFLFKDELTRMEAFLDLFKLIKRWGCTAILVAEEEQNVDRHHPKTVEFDVDGIILLYNIRKGDMRERAIEVLKLKGVEHSTRIFPMKITDKGIVVFPEETVF
ncbi:MAG: ATPase domain-containing protein [Candidatus Nanoarchaeia archaeon]